MPLSWVLNPCCCFWAPSFHGSLLVLPRGIYCAHFKSWAPSATWSSTACQIIEFQIWLLKLLLWGLFETIWSAGELSPMGKIWTHEMRESWADKALSFPPSSELFRSTVSGAAWKTFVWFQFCGLSSRHRMVIHCLTLFPFSLSFPHCGCHGITLTLNHCPGSKRIGVKKLAWWSLKSLFDVCVCFTERSNTLYHWATFSAPFVFLVLRQSLTKVPRQDLNLHSSCLSLPMCQCHRSVPLNLASHRLG